MSFLAQAARIVFSAALVCCAGAAAGHPTQSEAIGDPRSDAQPGDYQKTEAAESSLPRIAALISRPKSEENGLSRSLEPFGLATTNTSANMFAAKWGELQSRIQKEERKLAACRGDQQTCPAGARRFLEIVELGRGQQGRARLGLVNRAVNLSIRPVSDWAQYGMEDFWSPPVATLAAGAGDCEDYAIVKYAALRQAGSEPDDLRIAIVRDVRRDTIHAVVAARLNGDWLISAQVQ